LDPPTDVVALVISRGEDQLFGHYRPDS
jgi:hypothetical protein